MGVLEGFRSQQLEKFLRKERANHNPTKMASPLSEIKSIGILLDGKNAASIEFVQSYQQQLENQGKTVSVFAYVKKLSKDQTIPLPYFTKSNINWYAKPTKKEVVDFMQQPFDLLINFSPNKILALECICSLSHAKFVIGNGTDHFNYYYDFLIKLNNSNAPETFIENVHHYLNLQQ